MSSKPKPVPLDELVVTAHNTIEGLIVELARNPSTPGVVPQLRENLAREIGIGPQCLADAAAGRGGDATARRLDAVGAQGRLLAERVRHHDPTEFEALRRAIDDHFAEEAAVAKELVDEFPDDAGSMGSAYGKARDQRLYQL